MHAMPLARVRPGLPVILPKDLCIGFRNLAVSTFEDLPAAVKMLEHWNLHTSLDVGVIAVALIESGIASANRPMQVNEFDGFFEISDWA